MAVTTQPVVAAVAKEEESCCGGDGKQSQFDDDCGGGGGGNVGHAADDAMVVDSTLLDMEVNGAVCGDDDVKTAVQMRNYEEATVVVADQCCLPTAIEMMVE